MSREQTDPRIEALSDDAKSVGGHLFGMMRPGSESRLRLGNVVSKPTRKTAAALAEMVSAGVISKEADGAATIYRPLASFHPLMAAKMASMLDGVDDEPSESLFEPA